MVGFLKSIKVDVSFFLVFLASFIQVQVLQLVKAAPFKVFVIG